MDIFMSSTQENHVWLAMFTGLLACRSLLNCRGGEYYGFRSKQRSEKFHHVLELSMVIVDVWMRGLVGHNTW